MLQQKSSVFLGGKDQATERSNVDLSCVCMCEWIFSLGVFGLCCVKCALLFFYTRKYLYTYIYKYIRDSHCHSFFSDRPLCGFKTLEP